MNGTDPAACSARAGAWGAWSTLLGIVASGPLAVAWVEATHPQPPWQSPELFARHYHALQMLPYAGGILLVTAVLLLVASLHALAPAALRVRANLGLSCAGVFATLIFLNYALQTSYVPALARNYSPGDAALLSAFSMTNPESLAWALEMWGWGFSGAATWLLAPVFGGAPLERATRRLFVANGVTSLAGTAATVALPGWILTPAGLAAFLLWNLLFAALALLAAIALRRRARSGSARGGSPRQAPQALPRTAAPAALDV